MRKGTEPLYLGYEAPRLPDAGGRLPVALVFPGPERLALSTLGWQVVYRLLASRPEFLVDRFFLDPSAPGPAVSMDAGRSLDSYPLIALSWNFEEDARAFLAALGRAGIALTRSERSGYPLVLVGGPLAFMNPAPLAPAVDIFFVGEAEAGQLELALALHRGFLAGTDKSALLAEVAAMPGVYAPGLSRTPVARVTSGADDRRLAEPGFSCFVSPRAEFADMLLLEVNRGCPYGCRFCAAGFVYRPPRHADLKDLQAVVEMAAPAKVGLVGTALTDWPELPAFLHWLKERGTKFSLSSVRADGLTREFLAFLRRAGVRTITLALEGPSRRLRTAANKKLAEDDFLRAVSLCSELGVNHLKVYVIIGWPGETDADYAELAGFLDQIQAARAAGRGGRKKGLELVTLGVSCLVPKPFTPFQWAPMAGETELAARLKALKTMVKPLKGFQLSADNPAAARLQGLLARAGEEAFGLLVHSSRSGWREALTAWSGDPAKVLDRERAPDETFPWEVIDPGVSRSFLWREWQRYKVGQPTRSCPPEGCQVCRACGLESR